MNRVPVFLTIVTFTALVGSGCDVLFPQGDGSNIETPPAVSKLLRSFDSEAELNEYVGSQFGRSNDRQTLVGDDALPPGMVDEDQVAEPSGPTGGNGEAADGGSNFDSAAGDDDFSGTTTQEEGVDEADVVKTDGEFFYVISNNKLRIIRAQPVDQIALLGEVELEGYGRELYLRDGRVIALTEKYGVYLYGPEIAVDGGAAIDPARAQRTPIGDGEDIAPPEFEKPETIVTVVNVSQPSNPQVITKTSFEGNAASSRMIDGMLHLVIAAYPQYYDYITFADDGQSSGQSPQMNAAEMLPRFEHVDANGATTTGAVVTWRELLRPVDPDGFGVMTAVSLDVSSPADFSAVGIVAEPGLIYSSRGALYITDTNYNFSGDLRESTDIYKLSYSQQRAVPVAAGSVPGRVLNQYSMGEHEGYLRVATTVGPTFGPAGQQTQSVNNVYVLEDVAGELSMAGMVEGIAPNETIQSARFMGDRGFLVTFERIDPLFTLDLSDPQNPQIIGELKVPGFSTYMVPIDQDHLLAVGQYVPEDNVFGTRGVQLSIFDVSQFDDPQLMHNVVIGEDSGAHSEAVFNPKAFTYFASEGLVALPISIYERFISEEPVGGEPEPGELTADGMEERYVSLDEYEDGVSGEGSTGDSGGSSGSDGPGDPDGAGQVDPTAPGDDVVEPDEPVKPDEPTDEPGDGPADDPDVDLPGFFQPPGFDGLYVFDVSVENGFVQLGRLSGRFEEGRARFYYPSFTRGVFIGDYVYAVTNNGLRAAPIDAMDTEPVELVYGDANITFLDDVVIDSDVQTDGAEPPPSDDQPVSDMGGGSSGSSGSASPAAGKD